MCWNRNVITDMYFSIEVKKNLYFFMFDPFDYENVLALSYLELHGFGWLMSS